MSRKQNTESAASGPQSARQTDERLLSDRFPRSSQYHPEWAMKNGSGLVQEFDEPVPEHLQHFWSQDCWCLHSAEWWRRHWGRTGIVDVEVADTMPEG